MTIKKKARFFGKLFIQKGSSHWALHPITAISTDHSSVLRIFASGKFLAREKFVREYFVWE